MGLNLSNERMTAWRPHPRSYVAALFKKSSSREWGKGLKEEIHWKTEPFGVIVPKFETAPGAHCVMVLNSLRFHYNYRLEIRAFEILF